MTEPESLTPSYLNPNYYDQFGLPPSASGQEIRRAYRDLSKRYHPDTTELPTAVAKEKFQRLNEAYATLSNPERRLAYDRKIRYSRISVTQASPTLNQPFSRTTFKSSHRYLDPTDRPLSAGEIFALFILGLTFVACFILVITLGFTRGEAALSALQGSPHEVASEVASELTSDAASGDITGAASGELNSHELDPVEPEQPKTLPILSSSAPSPAAPPISRSEASNSVTPSPVNPNPVNPTVDRPNRAPNLPEAHISGDPPEDGVEAIESSLS